MEEPDTRDRYAWIAPLLSTLLTLPMGFFTLGVAGLSGMMCDSCSSVEGHQFENTLYVALGFLACGLLVSLGLLITSWALSWRKRNTARRQVFAAGAPVCVVVCFLVFYMVVEGAAPN